MEFFSYQDVYIYQRVNQIAAAMQLILEIETDGKRTHAQRNHCNHVMEMLIVELQEAVKQREDMTPIPF